MSIRLVIAEKPSVARAIAAVLGANQKRNGFLAGNDHLVSWCYGHLAELAAPQNYDPKYAHWNYEDLPILPKTWKFLVQERYQAQFRVLRTLLLQNNVAAVINACDAGREGELIFRTVYQLSGCTKPAKRLWISSMEEQAIRDGFAHLRPAEEFDGLYHSALCRAKADWLVGMNATRLFSLLYGSTLKVGRVQSPTLSLLVRREAEIAAFRPENFYIIQLNTPGFSARSKNITSKEEAEQLAERCKNSRATVKQIEHREHMENTPQLYDLTALQREANQKLGYTAQQTLDYLQSLYEKQLCSYPRTDSRFLTDDMAANAEALAAQLASVFHVELPTPYRSAQLCDSRQVGDHHALLLTKNVNADSLSGLPVGERTILELLVDRFFAALGSPCRTAETQIVLTCCGAEFFWTGTQIIDAGWRKTAKKRPADKSMEALREGADVELLSVSIKPGQTAPPSHYTEASLLQAMERSGGSASLGTPATRAGILEKLVQDGYVERRKCQNKTCLFPTQTATALIAALPDSLQSPSLTSEWEQQLTQIEQGQFAPEAFLENITGLLQEFVASANTVPEAVNLLPQTNVTVGVCPRCGGKVKEIPKGFVCENPRCRFALWKGSRFFAAKKILLTAKLVSQLLQAGQVKLYGCWSARTGKTYDAVAVLRDDGEMVSFELRFEDM